MTHLHIPDGILPVWLWVSGLIAMSLILGMILFSLQSMDMKRNIPLLGAISAIMLIAMSLEILPIGYHINLSVVAGILLGPGLGFVAAFIANLILAFMGHGGITVLGLNTILLGSETVLGHALFSFLRKRMPVFWSASAATALTLITTTLVLIGIVAIANLEPSVFSHDGHDHPSGVGGHAVSVSTFAVMVLSLGVIGWIIEAALTGSVVQFISRVKPDLLGHALHDPAAAAGPRLPSGDSQKPPRSRGRI